ncbi:MAG: HslU--HslV peptidase proteolytic subunit, partial [Fusobacteriaceae bacterium]
MEKLKATTIVAIKKDGKTSMAGDGQVTFGDIIFKNNAKKIRRLDNHI